LGLGLDWSTRGHLNPVISFQSAILRGGLLGHGTMARIDWLPSRNRTIGLGVSVPLLQPLAGRTRPRRIGVAAPTVGKSAMTPTPLSAEQNAVLARLGEAAALIGAYTDLYSRKTEQRLVGAESYPVAVDTYLNTLARAFSLAANDSALGEIITSRARAGLLDRVLIPFDSLFGQAKQDPSSIRYLTSSAQAELARWLRDSSQVSPPAQKTVLAVHARWLAIIEREHQSLLQEADDSRIVWLPLQFALAPDQYQDQEQVDSLIARVIGRPFTDRNALTYLHSTDLPMEIARSIYAARDYHVLWIHDFPGRRESGRVDNMGYSTVADVYLPALTEAVKRYDSTGRLPVYMILLDEYFYEPRDGRLWMNMLEDPLNASLSLPPGNGEREMHLRERREALRSAVVASARLERDAMRYGGADWIRRVVKVHVNITNPSDFSFRSGRIVPPIPFAPDNIMRDHRKIAFYDLNEADPYRGFMILMGIGIGEHYASPTWEDRGYRLRGPAALEVRAALRRALKRGGFEDTDIPEPLRVIKGAPPAATTERSANAGDYVGRALQVHNETGFGSKQSSVARAMLYNLASPGSVIVVPDPLWLSATWAGMLAGASARGAKVYVIAPALENAPSPEAPLMALAHDVLLRLLEIDQHLGNQIRQSGGELRVGLYAASAEATDGAGRAREVRDGLTRAPWIRNLFPFTAKALAVLDQAAAQTAGNEKGPVILAHDEKPRAPQLHQKTQFIARPGAIAALLRQSGWDEVLASAMKVQSQQTLEFAKQLAWTTPAVESNATLSTDAMLRGFEEGLSDADKKRVSFYFSAGTQNQDPRGIASDGEATIIVSGFHAAEGVVDLYYLMARSQWVRTEQELDQYLPPGTTFMRRLAQIVRFAL
jgi:hypothetical protein